MIRWCMVSEIWCVTDVIVIYHFRLFFPLLYTPLKARKIKSLKKWKKHREISSFYICVPKTMIRWCMVPEIWCMTDKIISHFGLFFALLPPLQPKKLKFWKNEKSTWRHHHFTHVHQKLWSEDLWFLRYAVRQTNGQTDGQKKWHIEVGTTAHPKKEFLHRCISKILFIDTEQVSKMRISLQEFFKDFVDRFRTTYLKSGLL